MVPVISVTPSLRVDGVKLYQDSKQQQTPFNQGKIFQGRITGKSDNKFILDVEGRQWLADSKAPLRIGQRLNLQVTGTKPHITLQILSGTLTRNIGKSLHLLVNEGSLLPKTLELAGQLPQEDLSGAARETIDFYGRATALFSQPPVQKNAPANQLAELLTDIIARTGPESAGKAGTTLSTFIENLLHTLPEHDSSRALVQQLMQQMRQQGPDISVPELLLAGKDPDADQEFKLLLNLITGQQDISESGLKEALAGLLPKDSRQSPSSLLLNLLSLTGNLLEDSKQKAPAAADGRNLKKIIGRLGTNLEQLLAEGKTEEAAKTLKGTLLEISHALTGNKPLQHQAEQLTSMLELFQMLQIRLAGESIFVLPLPLPFLNQGFLLIEPDNPQQDQQQENTAKKRYSLHLQLEGLGNLRIELQQDNSGLGIRFFSQDAERTKFLSENRRELENRLSAARLKSVQFLTGVKDPITELFADVTGATTGVLDTNA